MDHDSNALSFLGQFPEAPHGAEESSLMPVTINRHNARSNASPWSVLQALDNGNSNYSNGQLPHQEGMSAEILQATVPQTPKPKVILPSGESSNTSPTIAWQNTTLGTISPQPLGADRPEMRSQPKPGCRNGPLAPKNAEHAKEMREARACWSCRFAKVQVS